MLTAEQVAEFQQVGHLTVLDVFDEVSISSALKDIEQWSAEFLAQMDENQHRWYLEDAGKEQRQLRKLDNPAYHREPFQEMAKHPRLVAAVEQLIGEGVSVFFSQVFMKPPEGGGPKPVHQDNFYFGPDDLNATLTAWIALDHATVDNGCLYYGDGSHHEPVLDHFAPKNEPFNLQVPAVLMERFEMTPAPVPSGGVSFHHGNTLHQSSNNNSSRPRRAVAFHYLRNDATLVKPGLPYDSSLNVKIT